MPASSESALSLAGQLRELSDASLAELLGAREIRVSGIRDFFDLADALLDAESIQHALGRLDRPTLATLAVISDLGSISAADVTARLTALGATSTTDAHLAAAEGLALVTRVGGKYAVPGSVTTQLLSWPSVGLPTLTELVSIPAPAALAPVVDVDASVTDRVASEHAFSTTASIAELLWQLQHESARALARGGIALPDSKRLAAAMGVELGDVPALLDIAERAGLVTLSEAHWVPTEASTLWLVESPSARWALLADAWLQRLPLDILTVLREREHAVWGERLDVYLSWLFPAGGDWMHDRVRAYTRDAELLGITANHAPSSPGTALLAAGAEAAAARFETLFPAPATQVYLQRDLSIVSTGPLAPALDARLRTMADVEGRALASAYRVSTTSLNRAMASGETAQSIRDFLGEISLTGIPQPLDYLVTEAAARYGLVRVGALDGGRSYVSSTDDSLLRTLLVDHSLGPLGFALSGNRLVSGFDLDLAFWTLSDARYPVAAENSRGDVIVLRRRRASVNGPVGVDSTAALIERLRLGSSADPDVTGKAWLSRQLDVAIRSKLAVAVTVQLPDGSAIEYELEPASVAGGRLRARDRHSDIERTLPLSSITAVVPAS